MLDHLQDEKRTLWDRESMGNLPDSNTYTKCTLTNRRLPGPFSDEHECKLTSRRLPCTLTSRRLPLTSRRLPCTLTSLHADQPAPFRRTRCTLSSLRLPCTLTSRRLPIGLN
ncbi:hypothetical protein DPMN_177612 [Dreissena polymorpha]|uniref:Uncharacterized protein n=1 Tax=Dreissena polymorpha TaxID=45954 RepID=A0A9D4IKC4_DREPO|nr:hypothetical protein DPMN_177612 [Dreissena polymorpha]